MRANFERALRGMRLLFCTSLVLYFLNFPPVFASPPKFLKPLSTIIKVFTDKAVNSFRPSDALGAGVDGMEQGDIAKVYTPENVKAMLSAGFKPLTYRLRTELGVEAWHWNPIGTWSDAKNSRGYWTSEADPKDQIIISNGYSLPRRGSSSDQANNRGYSRLCDGDSASFWKSNPYLDAHFTHEANRLHPQWILIDFGKKVNTNTLKIEWGTPFAVKFRVEWWNGADPVEPDDIPEGRWVAFEKGEVSHCKGGLSVQRLSRRTIRTRLLRITLMESSGPSRIASEDIRDSLGFAIREISLGVETAKGVFIDAISHAKNAKAQTHMTVSSTDPWHASSDFDGNVEQPGFDRVFKSGLTNNLPVLFPVGLLYDTPENAVNEIRWLKSRGYRVAQVELGEEPDGQYITPEDYGALYIQWADAIHKVDPALKFGGPGFQTSTLGWETWPDEKGVSGWMFRFIRYLKERKHLQDFNFFSFEWYPFDNVAEDPAKNIQRNPRLLSDIFDKLKKEGVPTNIPWIISEYGYSAFSGRPEVEMPGAILNCDIVGQFLTLGGNVAYLYGYEPNTLIQEGDEETSWGNLMLFLSDKKGKILAKLPTLYAAQMLTEEWVQPGSELHELYLAKSGLRSKEGEPLICCYALKRPGGAWSFMLLNKDPKRVIKVEIKLMTGKSLTSFVGKEIVQYSPAQYLWKPDKAKGRPILNKPPLHKKIRSSEPLTLPAYSITILK